MDQLSRRILNEANLVEPFLFSTPTPVHDYAQTLVDGTYAKYPDLLALAIHAATPNGPQELIVGSTFGRLGKPSDEDDLKVSRSGTPSFEPEPAGGYEAILPLKDATGKTIGTVNLFLPAPLPETLPPPRQWPSPSATT